MPVGSKRHSTSISKNHKVEKTKKDKGWIFFIKNSTAEKIANTFTSTNSTFISGRVRK